MSVFHGSSTFLIDFFSTSRSDFLIPEYQREYSWDEENVVQLFRDLMIGLSKIDKSQNIENRKNLQSKFLGCIIRWKRPAVENSDYIPSQGINFIEDIYEIIDGQQRLSTISLLLCELYYYLENIKIKLDQTVNEERALYEYIEGTVQDEWLVKGFCRAGVSGASPKYRPLLIRQGVEQWSHNSTPNYKSSIAGYLHQCIIDIERINNNQHSQKPNPADPRVARIVKRINRNLEEIVSDKVALTILSQHYDQNELMEGICTGRRAIDLVEYLDSNPKRKETVTAIILYVALAHYLLNYCAFTVITSPNQDAALDMFQSLNATGVQLTAVQILKPHITKEYSKYNQSFSSSSHFKKYEEINTWLNNGRNKDTKTKQFFLKIGLIFNGEEVSSNLSSQRTWIIEAFKSYTLNSSNISRAEKFIDIMYSIYEFLDKFFFVKRDDLFDISSRALNRLIITHNQSSIPYGLSNKAAFCFLFLIESRHEISHTLLALFYLKFQESRGSSVQSAANDFFRMISICAAFFVLWRVSLVKERYPDEQYKSLFKNKFNYVGFSDLTASEVARAFKKAFKAAFMKEKNRRKLVSVVSNNIKYKSGWNSIIKFTLLTVASKRVPMSIANPNPNDCGLLISSNSGYDYLKPEIWISDDYRSIEHVVPQSILDHSQSYPHWEPSFYNSSDTIHSIGNLTLLSIGLNSSTPETTEEKYRHYLHTIMPGAPANVTQTAQNLLTSSPQMTHLMPIIFRLGEWLREIESANYPTEYDWDVKFVKNRANQISKLLCTDMLKWLS